MSSPATLVELLRERARDVPDAEVLAGGSVRHTWGAFEARSRRAACALRALGVRRGDRVAILARNRPEWVEVFCGVHKAGGVVVPVNDRLTPMERRWQLEDAGVSVLVGDRDLLSGTGFSGPTLALGSAYETRLAGAGENEDDVDTAPDELAVIAYTSGTTGTPKGVMWSHGGLLASSWLTPFPAAVAGGARILVCAPLSAGGAIVMTCNALAIGGIVTVTPFTPDGVLRALAEHSIEFTGLVPTMLSLLADAAPPGWRAPRLRRIYYGAGTLSPQLLARAQTLFACEFEQGYGMTETCILGTRLGPADHALERPERVASAGKPMPGVDVKVVDGDGSEVPPGTLGEILIRSPGNMLGYWRREDQSREAFVGGWYRTRDIGFLDAEGYLHLVDRKDEMVKSGGLNVSPSEVENVLTLHPDIEEAAVIGLPDERWGEQVTAVVRTRDGVDRAADDLLALCRHRLADYKRPRIVIFADEPLPRSGLGKVNRRAVRAKYGNREAQ